MELPIELLIELPRLRQQPGPGPGRLGSGLGGNQGGGWGGRGLGAWEGYLLSGKATYCQAKLPTVRQAKDRCQAKQRQSGKHPTVP